MMKPENKKFEKSETGESSCNLGFLGHVNTELEVSIRQSVN